MKFNLFFWRKKKTDVQKINAMVERGGIDVVFKECAKEIESLKQYDRGEKQIIAPDLKRLVQSLPRSR